MSLRANHNGRRNSIRKALLAVPYLERIIQSGKKLCLAGLDFLRALANLPATPEGDRTLVDRLSSNRTLKTVQALRVVVTLGVPELLSDSPVALDEVARRVEADPEALRRVMRHLANRGFFKETARGWFALTSAGAMLRPDHPHSRHQKFLLGGILPRIELAVTGMLHSVRTGGAAYAHVHGATLWDQIGQDPELARSFDLQFASHARTLGVDLAKAYAWEGVRTIVDVGGGTGETLAGILAGHSHLRGAILEFAGAGTRAQQAMAAAGAADRWTAIQGSFFDPIQPGADRYLLCWILHDWPDGEAVKILTRCREAAGRTGRVLIVEKVLGPLGDRVDTGLDLEMLVLFGSRERNLAEYHVLAEAAGLEVLTILRISRGFVVLECGSGVPGPEGN